MRQLILFVIASLLLVFIPISGFGQKKDTGPNPIQGENCYVWSFSKRSGERNELTDNLTREFEGGLVKRNLLTVLNRIKFADLFEQWNAEKSVQKVTDLPDSTINSFKVINAKLVIFGEIYEEKENGLIRLTIRIQNFESEIKLEEYQDANINRINSIAYRENLIGNLLDKLQYHITGKKPFRMFDNVQGMFNRNSYTRGITIEVLYIPAARGDGYPFTYRDSYASFPVRLTFQSMNRWGVSIGGGFIEDPDGQDMIWVGYSYLIAKNRESTFNFISTLSLGYCNSYSNSNSESYKDWIMTMVDLKIKYKIFTFNAGALIPQLIKVKETDNLTHSNRKITPILGAGIHLPF